jgi:hypothetical protein
MASRAGDFNRDGRDDIVAFKRGLSPNVYVALSKRSHFSGTGARAIWRDDFAEGNQVPGVGDFNGDGRDDIVAFKRGSSPDVYVALSRRSHFDGKAIWHHYFAADNEIPGVGDFDGDRRDDIVTFKRRSSNVYVALSTGSQFSGTGSDAIWRDDFAGGNQVPGVGDFNGDGRDDIVAFKRGSSGEVYVALSTGSEFRAPKKWRVGFAEGNQIPVPGNIW